MRLEVNPSALLECLHLEALGVHVSLRDLLVTLGGCRHLDGLEQRGSSSGGLLIVSGSDRGDCEGLLTFPRRRAKRYSSRLLVACVILILCWLRDTLLRVWRVMSISA